MTELQLVTTPAPYKLMDGSSTGPTYLPIARKGNVLLGAKPWGVADGAKYGVPNTTYFAARLRSAPENGLFAEEDAAKKVVKLSANPANLWDAWPGVIWETQGKKRASTTVGVLLRGKFDGNDLALQQLLVDEIAGGKLAGKFAAYLAQLAGADFLLMREAKIAKWLDAEYAPVLEGIQKSVKAVDMLSSEMTQNIGVFGMQAAVLNKVYKATKSTKDPEFDQAEDLDDTGDDEGEED
jgi:hypothetical protein